MTWVRVILSDNRMFMKCYPESSSLWGQMIRDQTVFSRQLHFSWSIYVCPYHFFVSYIVLWLHQDISSPHPQWGSPTYPYWMNSPTPPQEGNDTPSPKPDFEKEQPAFSLEHPLHIWCCGFSIPVLSGLRRCGKCFACSRNASNKPSGLFFFFFPISLGGLSNHEVDRNKLPCMVC